MHTLKQILSRRLFLFLLAILAFARPVGAKSVYVITDRDSTVNAYRIAGDQIQYQATAEDLPDNGLGAVGLALDPDSETLFVTYEQTDSQHPFNKIELINAKTMLVEQEPATAPGASNLAGIVFDQAKQKLYAVDRGTNKLFVYLWNPRAKTLILEGGTYKTLTDLEDNNAIDYNDLALFCKDWLWQAGWTRPFTCGFGHGAGRDMGSMGLESEQMMIAPYPAEAEAQEAQVEPIDIDEILKWLDEIWLEYDELREMIPEDEWQKFIEAVKESAG